MEGEQFESALKETTEEKTKAPENLPDEQPFEDENHAPEQKGRMGIFRLISIGNATGQSFLFNFFSAFAVEVGVSGSILGFITSIRNLMSSLFQGTIGRLSDRIGRRYLLLTGFFASFSIMIVLIFINNPIMLIIISIVQATALGIIVPVWNATLGDVTKSKDRAGFIGGLSSMGTAVSVSSMLLLATVFNYFDNRQGYIIKKWFFEFYVPTDILWRYEYGVAFGLAALNFVLCFIGVLFLKETRMKTNKKRKQPRMTIALKDKKFTRFFVINSVFGLIMATMWPIFPIAQVDLLGMGFTEIAITNVVFSICSSLSQFFGGKLGDKYGRKPFIIFGRMGMFLIPVVMIGAILLNDWRMLFLSNIIGGTAMGAMIVTQNAYILDLAPSDQMGAYSGLTQVGWGITTFIGSLSAGFIADAVEVAVGQKQMIIIIFSVIAVLRFIASLGYFFIQESLTKKSAEEVGIDIYQYSFEDSQMKSK